MVLKLKTISASLALVLLATPGFGAPTIQHDPIQVAEKGQPLGVRVTVHDAGARVETVTLFYAASRGMAPFRAPMSSSGAGMWYATIPAHMVGPGAQMFYYVQAENADGETRETDWQTVKVVEAGVAPEAIPSASAVAREAQQQAIPAKTGTTPAPTPAPKGGKSKYLIPAAIIVGGAVAVGGALAIATYDSGGGSSDDDSTTVTNGNYGGTYSYCFEPTSVSNTTTVCDSGLVNVYVEGADVEIVGLWNSEVLTATMNGSVFSATKSVSATTNFPEAYLIVAGEISGDSCTATVNGYSRDSENPGNFTGRFDTTKR